MKKTSKSSGIIQTTLNYEEFLRKHMLLLEDDLAIKHSKMIDSQLAFFRGTYYRWSELFPKVLSNLNNAPRVDAIGDLHVENFGTYRDKAGRLIWGVNDFDELDFLPYTNDLARLITSAIIAINEERLALKAAAACRAVLDGYKDQIKMGQRVPFIIGDNNDKASKKNRFLAKYVRNYLADSESWWKWITSLPRIGFDSLPPSAIALLEKVGITGHECATLYRRTSGVGSLGHRRIVAIFKNAGAKNKGSFAIKDRYSAYELKELGPPASVWLKGKVGGWNKNELAYMKSLRLDDTSLHIHGSWLIRRIAPDCIKIELTKIPKKRKEKHLLYNMGADTANIHLAKTKGAKSILSDLKSRDNEDRKADKWLLAASEKMVEIVEKDWKDWKRSQSHGSVGT